MVAWPCKAIWELVDSMVSVHGPFSTREDKGEEEYPQRWLGGTDEVSSVGKWELHEARGTSN